MTPVQELHKRHPERIQTPVVDHDEGLLRGHGRLVHRHIGMDAELVACTAVAFLDVVETPTTIINATVKHGIWKILVVIALLETLSPSHDSTVIYQHALKNMFRVKRCNTRFLACTVERVAPRTFGLTGVMIMRGT